MPLDLDAWQSRLDRLASDDGTPALAVGVLHGGATQHLAAGTLNLGTGVTATADSVFQIGSVTKAYTATLVHMLADEGLVDLDAPLVDVLPELTWGDASARALVTVRHLLTHTSGIDGDHFLDLGRGEDVLERYITTCGGLAQILPPGDAWSYCNTGFAIAGRLIERVTGLTWDDAIAQRLFAPLGMTRSCTLPEEALRHRAAFGHVPGPDGIVPAPVVATPRTMGPAGGIAASVDDVLALARLHLTGGFAPDGSRLLSEQAVRDAWTPQVPVPDPTLGTGWGLGWMTTDWAGTRVVGHDGGTVGQGAFLRILPEHGIAVVLVGNGPTVGDLMPEIVGGIVEELCGVTPPAPPAPADGAAAEPLDWAGVYERENMRLEVSEGEEGPSVTIRIGGPAAESLGQDAFSGAVARAADGTWLTDAIGGWMPLVPFATADGRRALHFAGRAQPLVTSR